MINEYFVVSRYVAAVPKEKDYTDFILNQFVSDLQNTKPSDLSNVIHEMFSVVKGDEIDITEMENEDD